MVQADNEPALTSLVESWSTLRAMKGGSRNNVESCLVAQLEEQRNLGKNDVSSRHDQNDSWIAEHAGFLVSSSMSAKTERHQMSASKASQRRCGGRRVRGCHSNEPPQNASSETNTTSGSREQSRSCWRRNDGIKTI